MDNKLHISFEDQRMVCLALVISVVLYAIVAGFALQSNEGQGLSEEPLEILETLTILLGATFSVAAILVRVMMNKRAARSDQDNRSKLRFQANFLPLAMLQTGGLVAITTWLFNGKAVPALVIACILLSLAIAMMPLRDPDASTRN